MCVMLVTKHMGDGTNTKGQYGYYTILLDVLVYLVTGVCSSYPIESIS